MPATTYSSSAALDELHLAYRRSVRRRVWGLLALLLVAMAAAVLDLSTGPARIPLATLVQTILAPGEAEAATEVIVWQLRLPATLLALAVGMALGLAGAEMQTVLNNPLASPYTLGLSSAAALGAALALVWQWTIPGIPAAWWLAGNAFVFALAAALLLDAVSRLRGLDTAAVVLFGIALVFACNALVALIQFTASAEALQGLIFWTMGSLSRADWSLVGIMALILLAVLPWSWRRAWVLTALRLGEERAVSLGVVLQRERLAALLRISLLAGAAVAAAGTIGFIGLVAPHIARRWFGEDHRFYLIGSALLGGALLAGASALAKVIVPDMTLPVGIVTALIGIPVFLWVIFRQGARP